MNQQRKALSSFRSFIRDLAEVYLKLESKLRLQLQQLHCVEFGYRIVELKLDERSSLEIKDLSFVIVGQFVASRKR